MRILIAAPVRCNEPWKVEAFKLYQDALDKLEKPENCEVDRFFILHNSEHLAPLVNGAYGVFNNDDGGYKTDETTHDWNWPKVYVMAEMKNAIIEYSLKKGYDYTFFVDSDLMLHPKTLISLLGSDKDIIAECFWTSWDKESQPMPNAWMFNEYLFTPEDLIKWKTPGVYKVGMSGACILFKNKVFKAGVNFSPISNVHVWGEDRWIGIRSAVHGFETWLDTRYEPKHLYRESEYLEYISQLKGGDNHG